MNRVLPAVTAPEKVPLTQAQHDLVVLAVVVAGFVLFAAFLHHAAARDEVSARYRPAVVAGMCVTGVAALSYVLLLHEVKTGYDPVDGRWVPNAEALQTISTRYLDWAVTVPILVVELLAVCTLLGGRLSRARTVAMAAAFTMIVTGYLGDQVFAGGESRFWLCFWWAVSSACLLVVYAVLVPAVRRSTRELPPEAGRALGRAATVLLGAFLVYPVVYLVQVVASGGWWTTAMHLGFSTADVVAKVGFGVLVHKTAKLRTAADVAAGDDTHPEPVWVDHVRHSHGHGHAHGPGRGVRAVGERPLPR